MHSTLLLVLLFAVALGVIAWQWRRQVALRREAWIRSFQFPPGLFTKVQTTYPQLTLKDCQLVAQALRQFFLTHLKSGRGYVSMPSQVTDVLWHEFILSTRNYEAFCSKAFGRFLHHTPAVAVQGGARHSNDGLRRCFWFACKEEQINPQRPSRLPLLFAIDAKFDVPGGYRYVPDCTAARAAGDAAVYCGADLGGGSSDGGSGSDGHGPYGGDGGSGDGGGCGGGGCGGGD